MSKPVFIASHSQRNLAETHLNKRTFEEPEEEEAPARFKCGSYLIGQGLAVGANYSPASSAPESSSNTAPNLLLSYLAYQHIFAFLGQLPNGAGYGSATTDERELL